MTILPPLGLTFYNFNFHLSHQQFWVSCHVKPLFACFFCKNEYEVFYSETFEGYISTSYLRDLIVKSTKNIKTNKKN